MWLVADPDVSYTVLTSCQREQLVAAKEGGGAFQPQCTVQGDYEVVQCSAFDCWCVNSQGKEIANTRLQRSLRQLQRPDCFNLGLCRNSSNKEAKMLTNLMRDIM